MNGERYNIETLADMAAIPESARGRFLAELGSILATVAESQGIAIIQGGEWIDDGKGESTVRLHADGEHLVDIKTMMGGAS